MKIDKPQWLEIGRWKRKRVRPEEDADSQQGHYNYINTYGLFR